MRELADGVRHARSSRARPTSLRYKIATGDEQTLRDVGRELALLLDHLREQRRG